MVYWKTSGENDVDRYEIEVAKGNDEFSGNRFIKIGEIDALGNSNNERNYSFVDIENNKSGVRYYRLKIVDNDGSIAYSVVRPVIFTDEVNWQVFPNPIDRDINLVFQANEGEAIDISIYDATGKLIIRTSQVATGFLQRVNMQLGDLVPKGIYLLNVVTETRKQSFKLFKK